MLQKALFKVHRGGLALGLLLACVLDKDVDNSLDDVCKRKQDDDLHKAEERIDERNGDARHRHVHKIEPEHSVGKIKHRRPEHDARDLDDEIDHRSTLAVDICADCGQQHRQRRTDGDAHDDGKGNGKIDHARGRQRL